MLKLKNRYDDEKLCNNPDKGWYAHYYDNSIDKYCAHYDPNDTLEDFPLMDHAYLRLAWGYLEPQEGQYNWEIIDKIIDPWVAAGKKSLSVFPAKKQVCSLTVMQHPSGCLTPAQNIPL